MTLVLEHHEELELDLQPSHDLLDLWRGTLSFRRLDILIRALPASSAFNTKRDPDSALIASWDVAEYQRALLIDMFGKANFKNWKPLPRPAETVKQQRADDERRRALIERYEARQAAVVRPRRKQR